MCVCMICMIGPPGGDGGGSGAAPTRVTTIIHRRSSQHVVLTLAFRQYVPRPATGTIILLLPAP